MKTPAFFVLREVKDLLEEFENYAYDHIMIANQSRVLFEVWQILRMLESVILFAHCPLIIHV